MKLVVSLLIASMILSQSALAFALLAQGAEPMTECSSSKFESAGPKDIYLRLNYGYRPLYRHCLLGNARAQPVCSENADSESVHGVLYLETVQPTGAFGFYANGLLIQQGDQKLSVEVSDRGMGFKKQTYAFLGGALKIRWGKKVRNASGQWLSVGEYETGGKNKGKKVTAVFCRANS